MGIIEYNGIDYSGTTFRSLTQAQYDALPDGEKANGVVYLITDKELTASDIKYTSARLVGDVLDIPHQSGTASSSDTIQIKPEVLSHTIILINCSVYGMAGTLTINKDSILRGAYTTGIRVYINDSEQVTLSINSTGMITITGASDSLDFNISGIL